jgi:hypothetical protein
MNIVRATESSGRSAPTWRKVEGKHSEWLFHVGETLPSQLCLFSQQKYLKCVHSFSDTLYYVDEIQALDRKFAWKFVTLEF